MIALTVCASTSGGHFNPCVTIAFAIHKGFPWRKVPRCVLPIPNLQEKNDLHLRPASYIISQILGAYVACLLVYLQWRTNILAVEAALSAAGELSAIQFTPTGPAGIFGLYLSSTSYSNLGVVFANEFFVDFFLALVIWACLDPSNFFAPPPVIPYTIGFAYAVAIWGYAPNGLAANSARDVGGRLAALTIYGKDAGGGRYAALAALTNIAATLVAVWFYEVFFFDSSRGESCHPFSGKRAWSGWELTSIFTVLPPAQRDFLYGHKAHAEHGDAKHGPVGGRPTRFSETASSNSQEKEKATIEHHA